MLDNSIHRLAEQIANERPSYLQINMWILALITELHLAHPLNLPIASHEGLSLVIENLEWNLQAVQLIAANGAPCPYCQQIVAFLKPIVLA